MKPEPNSTDDYTRLFALVDEIEGQSDRAAAIVGAAWLEEGLSSAIESFLHKDSKSWQRLFGGNGPMNNFSAKIDLARLLGLTTEIIRSDLHTIREVRNEFAHQIAHKTEYTKLEFTSSHIRDKCIALRCVQHESPNNPRMAFVRACAILNSDFETVATFGAKVPDGGQVFARVEGEA